MSASTKQLSRFVEFGRKIIGIGRNYSAHAAELNNPVPTEPVVFLKPPTSYITEGQEIRLPLGVSEIHHEVELGVVIGAGGAHIAESSALSHVGGYVLALDMTNRSLQQTLRDQGLPWALAKGFDTACPVSALITPDLLPTPQAADLWLRVNGAERQRGNTRDMIFSIASLVSYVSRHMALEVGDLILTGTPPGVGPVVSGDTIQCGLNNLTMTFKVA